MNRPVVFDRPAGWLSAAHLARVVSLDDPESLNRVQVRLISYSEIDGQDLPLWARVVAPFAGDDRGAFFMPDVDDEVLVVFPAAIRAIRSCSAACGTAPSGAGFDPAPRATATSASARRTASQITLDDQQGQETLTLRNARRADGHSEGRSRRGDHRGCERQLA